MITAKNKKRKTGFLPLCVNRFRFQRTFLSFLIYWLFCVQISFSLVQFTYFILEEQAKYTGCTGELVGERRKSELILGSSTYSGQFTVTILKYNIGICSATSCALLCTLCCCS
jgi:hypothetical protein